MTQRVKIVVNPADDDAFRSSAESMLRDGADTARELESKLRSKYPRARVVVGVRDGYYERWYVYRDGRWVRAAHARRVSDSTLYA